MKKKYEAPAMEKIIFDSSDIITASNEHGGIYQEYTDLHFGCNDTPTDHWVNPFSNPTPDENM